MIRQVPPLATRSRIPYPSTGEQHENNPDLVQLITGLKIIIQVGMVQLIHLSLIFQTPMLQDKMVQFARLDGLQIGVRLVQNMTAKIIMEVHL